MTTVPKNHYAEQATAETYSLAEGPLWDYRARELVWVDIHFGDVHRGILRAGRVVPTSKTHVDRTVGAVALRDRGGLLVAGHHELFEIEPGGTTVTPIARLVSQGERRRLNDGKTDPAGRFLVGTLSLGAGGPETLYQWHPGGEDVVDDDLGMSNGLGWSPDGTVLYSVDTLNHVVWRRPYDVGSGARGTREIFTEVPDGSPDGLCVDADGRVWLAVWGTGQVRAFTPDGCRHATVHVDAPYVSCPTFGGPGLDTLVITTAIDDLDETARAAHPRSGALFTARVDATGLPATAWRSSAP
ncbi:SMP-30/gluconolactonase/LRE family protein [Amycolatopsis sp. CA-126428]|uniref:SMP-30/gluconolactonase/LRE family protein n=1 Tax=Amycolatopsis sp. CA-126428 TaxID=2073158 RepID=UPI000CD2CA46|nr:SMP-30/gluconolactonase/LRE family protein [Amycolatopsis sp. CA-126428]